MKKTIVFIAILSVMLLSVPSVDATTNSLSGGVSLGTNYDSNVGRTPDNEIDEWETTISAFFSLRREGEKGAISFRYGQTFTYNYRTDESEWEDHRLFFNAYRELSDRLRFNISDTFVKTNDLWGDYLSSTATGLPEEQNDDTTGGNTDQADPTLSGQLGRQKFWANDFSTSFDYEYAENSIVTLGYTNRILEYDEPDNDNYKYDNPWISLSYWFNPRWNTSLSYNYTDARFDITEDFTTHGAGLSLGYTHSVQDSFSVGLNYSETNYDTLVPASPTDRNDNYSVSANLGWIHAFSPTQTLEMSAGPSYNNEDSGDDRTTANFNVLYTSIFENGSWFVGANGGFADRSFDGSDSGKGLSENQSIFTGVGWQVAKDLSANLGVNVRTDDFLQNPLDRNEKEYTGTASLSYRFSRWFYVSGRYMYNQLDADSNIDDYVDHRFFITLGTSGELKRW